jgi:hypothetical protein
MHNTPIRLTFHANATGVPLATDFARAVQHESPKGHHLPDYADRASAPL